jgi:hypothetical protein
VEESKHKTEHIGSSREGGGKKEKEKRLVKK